MTAVLLIGVPAGVTAQLEDGTSRHNKSHATKARLKILILCITASIKFRRIDIIILRLYFSLHHPHPPSLTPYNRRTNVSNSAKLQHRTF
jgi:hypothetical protein